jgi:hypothetical protein
MDLRAGPAHRGAFPFDATVSCKYVDEDLGGTSPKFACDTNADNQRLLCLDGHTGKAQGADCERPFMFVHDVGLTFGTATISNANDKAMSLADFARHR